MTSFRCLLRMPQPIPFSIALRRFLCLDVISGHRRALSQPSNSPANFDGFPMVSSFQIAESITGVKWRSMCFTSMVRCPTNFIRHCNLHPGADSFHIEPKKSECLTQTGAPSKLLVIYAATSPFQEIANFSMFNIAGSK